MQQQRVAFVLLFLTSVARSDIGDTASDLSKSEAFLAFFRSSTHEPQNYEKAEKGPLTTFSSPLSLDRKAGVENSFSRSEEGIRLRHHEGGANDELSANYFHHRLNELQPPESRLGLERRRKVREDRSADVAIPKVSSTDISGVYNHKDFETGLSNLGDVRKLKMCRLQRYMPEYIFRLHSCAVCYHFLRNITGIFKHKWNTTSKVVVKDGLLFRIHLLYTPITSENNKSTTVFANASDSSSPILSSFANNEARQKWVDCCEAAEDCCQRMLIHPPTPTNVTSARTDGGFCPATWDGWNCYDNTKSGSIVHAPCPHYIYTVLQVESSSSTSSCAQTSERVCQADGTWFAKGPYLEWTNYSSCASGFIQDQKQRTYVHVTAYALSIIATVPALVIFFSYKQLRVARIMLHQNLLISMLLNGFFVIAFKTIVMWNEYVTDSAPTSIINENGFPCRLLFMLTKYSRMTNYMWMFCEGYYLHKLIASAFAEQKSLLIFYVIGWVFPIIPTVIYASLRLVYANDRCWVVPQESFEWFLNGPSLLSLLINMIFLINIIRVLVTKLRAAHANEPSQYRKAVRATLVLFPLFGLHFGITIYRPKSTCKWMEIYLLVNDVLDGFQGAIVALIFCYLNGEVIQLLKRTYKRWSEQRSAGNCMGGQPSGFRMQSRASRGGSMFGRSVETTQCYSSVPVSPEICCKLNRLSFSTEKKHPSPDRKNGLNHGNGILKPTATVSSGSLNPPNHVNSVVKIKNSDSGTFTEIKLNNESSPTSTGTTQSVFEMKPQRSVSLSPSATNLKNGLKGEHQL